jgi:hypothetical protein
MNIVICGSRDFKDYTFFEKEADHIISGKTDVILISGGAKGTDTLAESYALQKGYKKDETFFEIKADWNTHGKKAGMIRNSEMIKVADMVIAFWDGKSPGTGHMVKEAKRKNIPLVIVDV